MIERDITPNTQKERKDGYNKNSIIKNIFDKNVKRKNVSKLINFTSKQTSFFYRFPSKSYKDKNIVIGVNDKMITTRYTDVHYV